MQFLASFTFCFFNKSTLSLQPDGPIPFCLKQLTTTIPQIPADVDLSGQTILVTGTNSGIGFESARLHAKHKARVILGVRNVEKGEIAAQRIRDEFEYAEVRVMKVDMESFESIKAFVEELEETESRLDIAVLNAGISHYQTSKSPTGYDIHLQVRTVFVQICGSLTRLLVDQTNTLGSIFLALLLLPILRKTRGVKGKPARLLFISSEVHAFSNFTEKTLPDAYRTLTEQFPNSVNGQSYHTSKLFTLLLAKQLADKVNSSEVIVGLATPGYSQSELLKDFRGPVSTMVEVIFSRSTEEGGRLCTLAAITSTDEDFHKGYNAHAKWTQYVRVSPEH